MSAPKPMSAELRRALGFTTTLDVQGKHFIVRRFGQIIGLTTHGDETDALIRETCGSAGEHTTNGERHE